MALRYPLKFEANMPFVHFKAYNYLCPVPDIDILDKFNEKKPAAIEEIALYMPGDFTENIQATWGLEDVFQGGQGQSLSSLIASNVIKSIQDKATEGSKIISSGEAALGKAPFPTDINIFRNIEPASFTLNFNMIPYDKTEGDTIVKIITLFKKSILPKFKKGDAFLKFPAVWDVTFTGIKGIGLETTDVYEMMCLTGCNVSYVSGSEGASVYKDGNPTNVRLSLSFQSLRKQYLMEG